MVAAVIVLEDSPLFNAGRGAVFNAAGRHELDAAVMDGANEQSRGGGRGAARQESRARGARGDGAHAARAARGRRGGPVRRPRRRSAGRVRLFLDAGARRRARPGARQRGSHRGGPSRHGRGGRPGSRRQPRRGDFHRWLHQQDGRGAWATPRSWARAPTRRTRRARFQARDPASTSCAPSLATTWRRACATGASTLEQAARGALARVAALGGDGGLIAVDRAGNVAMPFVSEGMYRGWARNGRLTGGHLSIECVMRVITRHACIYLVIPHPETRLCI